MTWLLKLATGNPLLILWVAGGIFLVGLTVGGGVAWTLQGWRLGTALATCEGRAREFEQAYLILAGKVDEQNAAVNDLTAKAAQARQAGRSALAKVEAVAKQREGEIAALRASLAAPTPVGQTCVQVWEQIRAGKL